jgi:hypothetical protein
MFSSVITNRCRIPTSVYPDITPVIYDLSSYASFSGQYTVVHIHGNHFSQYGPMGYSVVNFGKDKNIPVSFYNSQEISFVVPINSVPDIYSVTVANINFPSTLYSNSMPYIIL